MILSFCLIFVIVMFLAFLPSSDIPIETSHSMEFTNPIQNADSEELNIFENLLLKFSDSIIGKIEENSSKLQGTWELIDYNDDIIEGKEKIVKCTFNEDNTFTWNKYDDEENNYAKGIYKINGLYVENNEWEYVVDLKVTEFAIDGKIQTEPFTEEYEIYIVVEEDKTEALFYNINAKNYFYSQK